MEKLNVQVGFVYTQVMFCDDMGKLHFHRVMTDVDKPWESIKEVLIMVKQALCMDKPKGYNRQFEAVNIDMQYRKFEFTSTLETLREEMEYFISYGTQVCIQTVKEWNEVVEAKLDEEAEMWEIPGDVNHEELFLDLLWRQQNRAVELTHEEVESVRPFADGEAATGVGSRLESSEFVFDGTLVFYSEDKLTGKMVNDLRGSPEQISSWDDG